jgi:hypothetical protein
MMGCGMKKTAAGQHKLSFCIERRFLCWVLAAFPAFFF